MQKKLLLCLLAIILAALPLLSACAQPGPPAKDKIVIGGARSFSGPLAVIGDSAYRVVYEKFFEEVNADGGIYIAEYGKKLPVELKLYDDKSDMGTMTKLLEKSILEDKVDFILPPVSTAFLFAAAPIANKYGYIFLSAEGGATTIRDMLPSLPYVFIPLSFSDWYQIPVLADLLGEKGVKTAYIIYIADLFGIEYSGVAGIELPKRGIDVVRVKSVPPDIKDLSPIIKEAKAANVDAFLVLAYPDQVMLATGQSMELGFNPKVFLGGPGVNFGFYHTAFGDAVEGVLGFGTWNRKTSPAAKALADKLYAGKPEEANDWWGHILYWGALEFWKQSVEKAGTLDQKKIRDVMATSTFNTILGPTRFENGLMAKESHPGEIGQWQKGVFEVIGPKEKATAPMAYPKPAWPAKK